MLSLGHRRHQLRHHRQKVSQKKELPRMDRHKASPPTPTAPNHHQSQTTTHGLARPEKQSNEADASSPMPPPLASRNSTSLIRTLHCVYTHTHSRIHISRLAPLSSRIDTHTDPYRSDETLIRSDQKHLFIILYALGIYQFDESNTYDVTRKLFASYNLYISYSFA